jgi:HMG box factor, other
MSAIQNSLPSLPVPWKHRSAVQTQPADDTGRVIFTRQLWQRTMPDGNGSEPGVLNKSQSQNAQASHNNSATPSRRTSSNFSTRSQRRRSTSPSRGSKAPLTPEESPPKRTTKKRTADVIEVEDKELDSVTITPGHSRGSSGDSAIHVCICQPDPKIPRPRNGTYVNHVAKELTDHE